MTDTWLINLHRSYSFRSTNFVSEVYAVLLSYTSFVYVLCEFACLISFSEQEA